MPVMWNLKKWLALERDIYRPSELQTLIKEKTGVLLSLQAISALMNGKPNGIRFQTMQVLCDTLDCDICDFFNVTPGTQAEKKKQYKVVGGTSVRLYGVKEQSKRGENIFPDPDEYTEEGKLKQNKRAKNEDKR